ncbi:aminoglycoside phosphotransferase family protein [Saccharibacillus sp. CPCC 101409]|uniref:phosphotransferase family protein n=1 Tax=Saccharibacillus sp. CPCC 101409 TaxID=3058041 RepID=UPI0026729972|nr:aminoglycoside phosphotransferase family protein [Saccharibacillus sp. CPCC 101409]MDO3410798.1 aminoglycoside phosphotransferase family protein [Saccharibacillus sp. CPCC 101409]
MNRDEPGPVGRVIAPLGEIIEAYPVTGGASRDRKFKVHFYGYDSAYLLRLFDDSSLPVKRNEFEALHRMQALTVHCSRPIAMGRWEPEGLYFLLVSFIEGVDAAAALPLSPKPQQLRIGIQAGEELRRIGGYAAPEGVTGWARRRLEASERDIGLLRERGVSFRGAQEAAALTLRGGELMQGRPSSFLHGSFRPANLIVQSGRLAGIVGFGQFGWGDPLYEFAGLPVHARDVSALFCTGQILGYHGGQEPCPEFWSLYALYAAMGVFAALAQAAEHAPERLPAVIAQAERLGDDHNGFAAEKPDWFAEL